MGRRLPQIGVILEEELWRQSGVQIPLYGLPTSSGSEIAFAPGLSEDWGSSVVVDPPEWETLYSRNIGAKTVFHERSRVTGRARSVTTKNTFSTDEDAVVKSMYALKTVRAASVAHTIGAERKALRLLRKRVSAEQWRSYVLTGMFTEVSKKSHLVYLFRRVAPTVVFRMVADSEGLYMKPFITLCLHPVGYTVFSGVGCMCPTDDIVAHVTLMRSDEHFFWKKATQHTLRETVSLL